MYYVLVCISMNSNTFLTFSSFWQNSHHRPFIPPPTASCFFQPFPSFAGSEQNILLFIVFKAFPNYSANASILGIFLIRCEQCGAVGVREHLVESLKVSSYDWNGQGEDQNLDISMIIENCILYHAIS